MGGMSAARYDEGWEQQWDDMKTYGPFSRHVRRLIKHVIVPLEFESILDVGCGQGALLIEFAKMFPRARLFGTDLSSAAVRIAHQRVPQGNFSVLDATKELMDGQYHLIVCSEVLEHIPDDVAALRNLRLMTRKYLLVTTPQGRMRSFEAGEVGHVRNYAHGELELKMMQVGLEPLRTIEWGFPLYSPIYRNYLELTAGRGTMGRFGPTRKVLASALYYVFMLNSWKRGDELVVLARPASGPHGGIL